LQHNIFNRCKSDLKFLEAAAARVVALASPTVYAKVIEDGRTGLVFHSAEDLRQKLRFIIENRDAARAMADQAHDYVRHHRMLASQVASRLDWYRSLWARRDSLTRDLLARVPELAVRPDETEKVPALATGPESMGRVVILSRGSPAAE
jgi:hypothetical protein